MQGTQMLITDVFNQNSGTFVIPVFQRNYDWKIEQCTRLLQDLEKLIEVRKSDETAEHFFGSTVRKINNTPTGYETMLIDGQQRMVTTTLLLLVLRNLFMQAKEKESDELKVENYTEKILEIGQLLFFKRKSEKMRRFHLSLRDDKAYAALFNQESLLNDSTHVTENYKYIYDHISKSNLNLEDWLDAINGLRIIDIRLDEKESAQEIFESLNSTGLALSHSDMIRNFLLMDLPATKQQEFYEDYWLKAEALTNEQKVTMDDFFRDFLTMQNQSVCAKGSIYKEYRNYAQKKDIATLMQELREASHDWGWIIGTLQDDKLISSNMKHLRQTKQNVIRPFLLSLSKRYRNKELSYEEFNQALRIVESYLMRYILAGGKSNGLNTMFSSLDREIGNLDSNSDHYVDKLIYKLMTIEGDYRFRNNDEFEEAISTYRYRTADRKLLGNILDRLENCDSKEGQDILSKVEEGAYSIEHIMPQRLNKDWVNSLGLNYEKIHTQLVNSLGNLTVTAYNSQYSNQSFEKKKTLEGGYTSSGIRLNQEIAKHSNWGEKEIDERLNWMIQQMEKAFPYPQTNYQPPKKVYTKIGLEDSFNPEYYPIILTLDGTIFNKLNSLKNVMVITIKDLYIKNPNIFKEWAQKENHSFSTYAKDDKYERIAENIYIDGSLSNPNKWTLLKTMFSLTNTPLDTFELEVGIRKGKEKKSEA